MLKRRAEEGQPSKRQHSSGNGLVLKQLWSHQRRAIAWMLKREQPSERALPSGGILGDEMGLGKTASILGLIFLQYLKHPERQSLIVVPASLLHKWRHEWHKHFAAGDDTVLLYHGEHRAGCVQWSSEQQRWRLRSSACVIITTCGQVLSEFKAAQRASEADPLAGCSSEAGYRFGALATTDFYRIVVDESHLSLKNSKAKGFAAMLGMHALRRWAVTGTVHTNSWTDVASVCRWIGVQPYNDPEWWKDNWTLGVAVKMWRFGDKAKFRGEARTQGFLLSDNGSETLSYILIRTKALIKGLPLLTVETAQLEFTKGELFAYDNIACDFRLALSTYFRALKSKVSKRKPTNVEDKAPAPNTAHLFRIICKFLTKIRQFCIHPRLAEGAAQTERFRLGQEQPASVCVECSEQEGLRAAPQCGHLLCTSCQESVGQRCSSCQLEPEQQPISQRASQQRFYTGSKQLRCRHCSAPGHSDWLHPECAMKQPASDSTHRYGEVGYSTKFSAILCMLERWRECDRADGCTQPFKVVIFSQWISCFNLLEPVLKLNGYGTLRFTGEITDLEKRNQRLQQFAAEPQLHILLCGLKVGGVGLDLVMASRAILLEPWFNGPVEDQAQDRLHRMGQTRPVQVLKLNIHWSAEDWMLALKERKLAESRWLRGEWNGSASSNAQFTSKDLNRLANYLCRSYYVDHAVVSK